MCRGEVDIIAGEKAVNKKVKCRQCGFSNEFEQGSRATEIVVIRKNRAQ